MAFQGRRTRSLQELTALEGHYTPTCNIGLHNLTRAGIPPGCNEGGNLEPVVERSLKCSLKCRPKKRDQNCHLF